MIKFDASAMLAAVREQTAKISEAAGESTMRKAAVAGAAIFRDEAILNAAANRKTGALMDNIIMKHVPEESDGANKQQYMVTVRTGKFGEDGDPYYWRWVEDGHRIIGKARNKRDTLTKRRVAALEFGTARVPAYPFMRPAYESKKAEVIDVVKKRLAQEIAEALK